MNESNGGCIYYENSFSMDLISKGLLISIEEAVQNCFAVVLD